MVILEFRLNFFFLELYQRHSTDFTRLLCCPEERYQTK